MPIAVRMSGISKSFGAVKALQDVDLEVTAGTVHAIVGENGAGKTTLMRILYGAGPADSGTLEIDEKPAHFSTPAQAISAGVGMVSQHYGIIPGLTAIQNLVLGSEPGVLLNKKALIERATKFADEMGFAFDWNADAETLSPAACQKLEILKLLWKGSRILILDEPTAMLSPLDGEALFGSLKRLVEKGATVLLVTHRLPEVMDHCQRVTVLRGGKRIADMAVADTSDRELAKLIVGGELAELTPRAEVRSETLLEVDQLSVKGERGNLAVTGASLTIKAGELVGIAGVDGSGQRELVRALLGISHTESGSIRFEGNDITRRNAAERIALGIRALPEDRISEAEIESWSLELNAALGLQRFSELSRGPIVDYAARKALAGAIADRFSTKHGGLGMPIAGLSGGNQQRFIAARTLALYPKLIIGFQPARGLDLHGTRAVYDGIRQACDTGAAALIVSFDLDELLENCDRVVTLFNGILAEAPAGHERDRDTIGRQMVGVA